MVAAACRIYVHLTHCSLTRKFSWLVGFLSRRLSSFLSSACIHVEFLGVHNNWTFVFFAFGRHVLSGCVTVKSFDAAQMGRETKMKLQRGFIFVLLFLSRSKITRRRHRRKICWFLFARILFDRERNRNARVYCVSHPPCDIRHSILMKSLMELNTFRHSKFRLMAPTS